MRYLFMNKERIKGIVKAAFYAVTTGKDEYRG